MLHDTGFSSLKHLKPYIKVNKNSDIYDKEKAMILQWKVQVLISHNRYCTEN